MTQKDRKRSEMAGPRTTLRDDILDGPVPSEEEVIVYDIFLGWLQVFSMEDDQLYENLTKDEGVTVEEMRSEIEDSVSRGLYVRYQIDDDYTLLVSCLDKGELAYRGPPRMYPVRYLNSPLRNQLAPVLQEILAAAGGRLTEDDKDWVYEVLDI